VIQKALDSLKSSCKGASIDGADHFQVLNYEDKRTRINLDDIIDHTSNFYNGLLVADKNQIKAM